MCILMGKYTVSGQNEPLGAVKIIEECQYHGYSCCSYYICCSPRHPGLVDLVHSPTMECEWLVRLL